MKLQANEADDRLWGVLPKFAFPPWSSPVEGVTTDCHNMYCNFSCKLITVERCAGQFPECAF